MKSKRDWFRFSFGVLQDSRNPHCKSRQVLLIHFVNMTKGSGTRVRLGGFVFVVLS